MCALKFQDCGGLSMLVRNSLVALLEALCAQTHAATELNIFFFIYPEHTELTCTALSPSRALEYAQGSFALA